MKFKTYYHEEATRVGRKCTVSFTTFHYDVQLIAYVGRVRVNYFMSVENMANDGKAVPVTANYLSIVFPDQFAILKASAGVRMYKGV